MANNCFNFYFSFLLFSGIIISPIALTEASLPTVFIFGDSTFDVGTNNFLRGSLALANFPFNGIDYPYSIPTGRFSNGYNTADQIVRLLGYKRSPPSYFSLVNHISSFKKRILQGVNFASGGSGILHSTGSGPYKNVVSLQDQIHQFTSVGENITELLGSKNTAKLLSESLFLISVGGNDLFEYYFNKIIIKASPNLTDEEFLDVLAATYQLHIQNLYNLGARKFGIVSVAPIGCCPSQRFIYKSAECVKGLNDLAESLLNATHSFLIYLSSQLKDMKYSLGNAFGMTVDIIDNPLVFGLKEVKEACCGNGSFNGGVPCNASANLCSNRKEYLFWDWFHPTESISRLAALTLFGGEPKYVTPMNFSQLLGS